MPAPKITLYVDIISPFAYLGYYMVRNSPVFRPAQVIYVPILLGGLMKACDNRPPLEIRNKDKWIEVERLRWARQFNVPISLERPKDFPKPTLHLMRFLTSLSMSSPDSLPVALDKLYEAFWTEPNESDLPTPEVFARVLTPVLGEAVVKEHLGKMATPDVKKRLLQNTDTAFGDGAFGLPWFQCTNAKGDVEGFWGFDHLGQVVRFLGLDGKDEIRALL